MTLSFIYFYVLCGLLGLAIGSFLNVVIYRLPQMLEDRWLNAAASNLSSSSLSSLPYGLESTLESADNSTSTKKTSKSTLTQLGTSIASTMSLLYPRSFCPHCKMGIKARHNVPLVSYFWLQGRCYSCKMFISSRYPLVELVTCIFTLLAVAVFGLTLQLPFILMFIWIAIALFFIDLETQYLPDSLTLGLLWIGLLTNCCPSSALVALPNAVFSAASAYLCLWLFTQLFYLLRGKVGMGHGDFKLFAALGAWFGWQTLPFILVSASLTGAIIGIVYLKWQKKDNDTPIPFGPFLVTAGLFCLFYGRPILFL